MGWGSSNLDFRYANGSSARTLGLTVDGEAQPGSGLAFIGTGSWSTWKLAGVAVILTAGTHRIRLIAIAKGGPNVDSLTVRPAP